MGLDRADCLHLIVCRQAPVITVDNALDEFFLEPHRTNFYTLAIKKIFQKISGSSSRCLLAFCIDCSYNKRHKTRTAYSHIYRQSREN